MKSDTEATVKWTCEKAIVEARIVAQAAPPHLMDGLLITGTPR